jgi:hypothetical protein
MGNDELLAAYYQALAKYEAAKAGYRPQAFVEFLVVERTLASRVGHEALANTSREC